MIKVLLIVLLLAGTAMAVDPIVQNIGPFSGLNNQDSPLAIPAVNAQDLLNVDITPGGRSVKKRHGYGQDVVLGSTEPVHGGYHFFDASGNDIRLWSNDVDVSASSNGGAYTVIVSSNHTKGTTMTCTDSQGLAWCVSSNNDQVFRTNGVSVTWFPLIATGTVITAGPDRLAIANTVANPNTINFSAQGDFTTFTTGSQPSSAFAESILAPGSHITHMRYWNGRYLWWKDQSFGYVAVDSINGQFNVQIVIVSNLVGTYDNASVENEGIIYFRGQDNHIWAYDGASLVRLTREITPTVSNSNKRKSNSWTQSRASDFANGNLNTVSTAATTSALYLDYSNSSAQQTTTWNSGSSGWANWNGNWVFQNGNSISISCGSPSCTDYLSRTNTAGYGRWQTTYTFSAGEPTGSNSILRMYFMANAAPTASSDFSNGYCVRILYPTGSTTATLSLIRKDDTSDDGGTILSSTTFTDTVGSDVDHIVYVSRFPNGYMTVNKDSGAQILTATDVTYSSGTYFGFYGKSPHGYPLYATDAATIYKPADAITGVYQSAVNNAPNLTSWATLNVASTNNGGTQTFSMRSSTNSFTVTSATPAYTTQTAGQTISISTGTYFQFMDTMTVTLSTQSPFLSNFTVNWFEGNAADQAYGTYFDFGIWWSISYSTAATTNNRILRYDLLNQTWTVYDITANGFLVQNNLLYFGSPTTGKVYVYANGNESDNGSAINSYWMSKDFSNVSVNGPTGIYGYQPSDNPFVKKDFRTMSVFATSASTGTLTVTYQTDRQSPVSYSFNLLDPNGLLTTHSNQNLPYGTKGYAFDAKFGNNATNQPWELLGASYSYLPGAWYPYP